MRTYRNIIILVVVLGLVIGGYFFLNRMPSKTSADSTNKTSTTQQAKPEYLINVDKAKMAEITIKNSEGTFVYENKGTEWSLVSPKGLRFSKSSIETIVGVASAVVTKKVAEENATDLSQYGFGAPVEVAVKMDDGSLHNFEIGAMTPTKDACYAKLKDSKKVYIVEAYYGATLTAKKTDMLDKTIFGADADDIIGISLEKNGKLVFSSSKKSTGEWGLVSPLEANGNSKNIQTVVDSAANTNVVSFVDENSSDLSMYGLDKPLYAIGVETSKGKSKLLFGIDKVKGSEVYAKLADDKAVFILDPSAFTFLDKPIMEFLDSFVYLAYMSDVSKLEVNIDGQTISSDIKADKEKKDEDKFTLNGKDVKAASTNGDTLFRNYYKAVIGMTVDQVELGSKPALGKPDITITYTLKSSPGTMKVEFVPKDDKYYYVFKNGKFSNLLVEKKQFDAKESIRDSYKVLNDELNKKK